MKNNPKITEKFALIAKFEQEGEFDKALSSYNDMLRQFSSDRLPILLEMALFLFRSNSFGQALDILVKCHQAEYKKKEIEDIILQAYYEPNIEGFQTRYEKNINMLCNYPGIITREFPDFEELSSRFIPFSETKYITYESNNARFTQIIDFSSKTVDVSANPHQPYLIKDEYNISDLIGLEQMTRKDNSGTFCTTQHPLYLLYSSRDAFVEHLQIFSLESLLVGQRVIFLFGLQEVKDYFLTNTAIFPTLFLNIDGKDDPYYKNIEECKQTLVQRKDIGYQNLMHMFRASIEIT